MEEIGRQLLSLEKQALGRWSHGDPSGFLDLSAGDVVYFDPFLKQRLDGLPALSAYYESIRGKTHATRFDMLNPLVQVLENAAVLTYNFVTHDDKGDALRWNCTEVFRYAHGTWKIIQTHRSFTASDTPEG
jgi:hypothetical protein